MLQNIVGVYDDSDAINDAVESLECCKYYMITIWKPIQKILVIIKT